MSVGEFKVQFEHHKEGFYDPLKVEFAHDVVGFYVRTGDSPWLLVGFYPWQEIVPIWRFIARVVAWVMALPPKWNAT